MTQDEVKEALRSVGFAINATVIPKLRWFAERETLSEHAPVFRVFPEHVLILGHETEVLHSSVTLEASYVGVHRRGAVTITINLDAEDFLSNLESIERQLEAAWKAMICEGLS